VPATVMSPGSAETTADARAVPAAHRPPRGGRWQHRVRFVMRSLGELLITAGVILLLFCAYEIWFTGLYTSHEQSALRHTLARQWGRQVPQPMAVGAPVDETAIAAQRAAPEGQAFAILRIPRLGRGYTKVVVEGVSTEDLKKGPGHYPGTALPGQIGNVAIAGHRTTYGEPFNRLAELRPGDTISVETAGWLFIYSVTGETVVSPTDTGVALPVPGHPGARPGARLLTLTTCHPEYSATHRLVVRASLRSGQPDRAASPVHDRKAP
jgi:sortase A